MSKKDEGLTVSPNDSKPLVSSRLFEWIFPKYTKWKLLEVYYFNHSWYTVQVRQNVNTGYKQFKCKKIIGWHYGHSVKNLSIEGIDAVLNGC